MPWQLPVFLVLAGCALMGVGVVRVAHKSWSDEQADCEARGGVYIQGRDKNYCVRKDAPSSISPAEK